MKRPKTKHKPKPMIKRVFDHPIMQHSRFSKANLAIFILIFAGIGGYILLQSHAAGSTANIFVSPNGSDSGVNCVRSASPITQPADLTTVCATWNKAAQLAQGGDTVGVTAGAYAEQDIINDGKTGPAVVTFVPSGNVSVGMGSAGCAGLSTCSLIVDAHADYLTFQGTETRADVWAGNRNGFDFTGQVIGGDRSTGTNPPTHVTFNNVNFGRQVTWYGSYVTFNGGQRGSDSLSEDGFQFQSSNGARTNALVENMVMHDITQNAGHDDCIQFFGFQADAVKNNIFYNCNSTDVFASMHDNQGSPGRESGVGLDIEGNLFGPNLTAANMDTALVSWGSDAGVAVQACDQVIVAYNTVVGGKTITGGCNDSSGNYVASRSQVYGNVLPFIGSGNSCSIGTYKYNFVTSVGSVNTCSDSTNLVASQTLSQDFVNPASCTVGQSCNQAPPIDWTPKASSEIIDKGDPARLPSPNLDMNGVIRPQGSVADAGAFEYKSPINVWVTANGNDSTCVRGDQTKPCATFLKAYQIAQCGDTVNIGNGSYGAQTLGHATAGQNTDAQDCSANNNPVIFEGESQAGVIINGAINIGEPWLTINNVTASGLYVNGYDSTIGCYTNPVQHVLVSNTIVDGASAVFNPMGMENVQFVSLVNDSIGNITNGETEIHNGGSSCAVINNHITITGTTFHDFINTNNGSTHMECLQIDMGVAGTSNSFFSVIGNKFLNCGQYDIFTSGPQHDMTYQNNWFDDPCSNQGSGCSFLSPTSMGPNPDGSGDFYNIVVTFNSYKSDAQWPTATLTGTVTGNIIAYNIFPTSALDGLTSRCGSLMNAVRLSNYVNGNVTCAGDIKSAVTYVSPTPPTYNFDLATGSNGLNALSPCPASAPTTDIHGNPRPAVGLSTCSVGAAEYVTIPPIPTVSLSAAPTTINSGSSSTLTWSSTNATSCSASGSWSGSKATSGSQSTGNLTTGSTYTLTCSGPGGTSSPASAQVTVNNAPPPPPPPVTTKKGDCNGDGLVNLTDLSILLSHYNTNYSPAEFDGNSLVSLADLSILLSNYGK